MQQAQAQIVLSFRLLKSSNNQDKSLNIGEYQFEIKKNDNLTLKLGKQINSYKIVLKSETSNKLSEKLFLNIINAIINAINKSDYNNITLFDNEERYNFYYTLGFKDNKIHINIFFAAKGVQMQEKHFIERKINEVCMLNLMLENQGDIKKTLDAITSENVGEELKQIIIHKYDKDEDFSDAVSEEISTEQSPKNTTGDEMVQAAPGFIGDTAGAGAGAAVPAAPAADPAAGGDSNAGHPKTHHPQTRRRQPTTSTTTHPPLTRHTRRKHRTHPTN